MPEKESPKFKLPYPTSAGEVKLGATDFEELALKLDTLLGEKLLIVKKYAAGATLASGELAVQELTAQTFTLPAVATPNQIIGIFSTVAETKVTAAANIIGDGTNAATIKLSTNQHLVVQSNGTNWMIDRGEPKRENAYTLATFTSAEAVTAREISATRPVIANFTIVGEAAKVLSCGLQVGAGVFLEVGTVSMGAATGVTEATVSGVFLNPGDKWKIRAAVNVTSVEVFSKLL